MIHRHPHVFGQVKADTSEQVLANWEVIKTEEKQRVSLSDQLQAIPPMLPALMRAQKVGKKMNADAELSDSELIERVSNDLGRMSDAVTAEEQKQLLGNALFRLTTLCRRLGLDAEETLTATTEKTIRNAK